MDGAFGQWTEWTECGDSCTRNRTRLCDSPTPQGNGKLCEGHRDEVRACFDLPQCNGKILEKSYKVSSLQTQEQPSIGTLI